MLARCRYGTEVRPQMLRLLLVSITIVLGGCTAAAQSPAGPDPMGRSDPVVNEINRRVTTCYGDPLDFYDNRDYCLRIVECKDYDR